MKLGFFTDSHYSTGTSKEIRSNADKSLEKIRRGYEFFKKENCDMVICLGDLIDMENEHKTEIKTLREVSNVIRSFGIPTVCVMGNHDALAFTEKEFYDILGKECYPENRVVDNKRFVFMDACFFKDGTRYATHPEHFDWTDTFYPFEQELEKICMQSREDIFVFIYKNLDPEADKSHLLYNNEKINEILSRSGKVKAVYRGHYHAGHKSVHNKIRYVTFSSVYDFENSFFVETI